MMNYEYFTESRMKELEQMLENFTESGCKTVEEMLLAFLEEHRDIDPFVPDMTVVFTDEYANELVVILNQAEICCVLNAIDEKLSNNERTELLPLEEEKAHLVHDYYFGRKIPHEEIEAASSYEELDKMIAGVFFDGGGGASE